MRKLLYAASVAAFMAAYSGAIAQPITTRTDATIPLPTGSCFLVSQWTGSAFVDRKLCSNYPVALGAAISTRSIGTSGLLTGGGDLTADRTISIAPQAPCTLVANAGTGSAVPTAVGLGTGLACSGGQVIVTASGTGDVTGPASAVDNRIVVFDGITGKQIKDGGVLVSGLAPATSGTSILKGNNAGGFANAVASTDYAPPTSGTAILKGNNTGGFAAAVDGTDFSLIDPLVCSGTDKFSGVTAAGVFTCTADTGTGGSISVTDGVTTVDPTTEILFGTSLVVTDNTGGVAGVSIVNVQNNQSSPTYTLLLSDGTKTVNMTNASPTNVTVLPAATAGATYSTYVSCDAGCTLTRSDLDTINGATSIVIAARQSISLSSDGVTGWRAAILSATDPSNASNLGSGTVSSNRGGAGSVNGILQADGLGVVTAATAGTHYAPATSGSAILKGNNAGGFANAVDGTDFSLINPLTCSGTDKFSGVTAAGVFTCTADTGGGGLTLTGVTNGSLLYDNNDVLGGVTLAAGLDITAGVLSLKTVVNSQPGTPYTVIADDSNKTIRTTNAGTVTLNITPAATLGNGFGFGVECDGAGGCIIDPDGVEPIDGALTLTLAQHQKAWISTDGTGWRGEVGAYRDPSNASYLTSGTVAPARLGSGTPDGTKFLRDDNSWVTVSGSGDVVGPASSVSGNFVTFNGTTGKSIQDSGKAPSGTGASVVTTTGAQTEGRCVTIDSAGNHVQHSSPCGSAAAGAMTLVSTITANNTSPAVTFSGLTGNDYKLTCRNLAPATDGVRILIQFSIGGTFITANYDWSGDGLQIGTGTYSADGFVGDAGISIRSQASTISNNAVGVTLDFLLFSLASVTEHRVIGKSISLSNTGVRLGLDVSGWYTGATTAVDGVRVITTSGNLNSGSCSLYSIAN